MSRPSYSINMLTQFDSSCEDIFACLYNLSTSEINLMTILLKSREPLTLKSLANRISRDKGTVFRSLQKLVNLGICNKEAKTQKGGGLYHVYSAIDIQIFKMETEKKVKELEASFRRILRQFEKDMDNMVKAFYQA